MENFQEICEKLILADDACEKKENKLKAKMFSINLCKNAITQREDELKFLRPADDKDIDYRTRQLCDFCKKVKETLPADSRLCFHGTRIQNVENIIKSGGLSSSVDRLGYETSYDVEDQVSVTTRNTIETTIGGRLGGGYAGLAEFEFPAGCVFVLLPKDENEVRSSQSSMLIGNVDFKSEPKRLVAIVTSPESKPMVEKWCRENSVESNILDYDGFIEHIAQKNAEKFAEKTL